MSAEVEQNPKIAEGTVLLNLSLGQISNRKTLSSDTSAIETDIDRKMLHVGVDLYDSKELKKCQRFLAALKLNIRSKSVPSFFRGGIYLVKHEALEEIDDVLHKATEGFRPLVDAFALVSEARRDEAKERLGRVFNVEHYPTPEQIKALYSISWNWFTMDTPDSLKKISRKIYEHEVQKAEESVQSAADSINKMLALEAQGLCAHMVEMLTPGKDGKTRVFRGNSTNAITKFLSTFRMRDIGTTEALKKQIKRMEQLLEGISAEELRKSATLRGDLNKGFTAVGKILEALVIEKPRRFISLKEVHDDRHADRRRS